MSVWHSVILERMQSKPGDWGYDLARRVAETRARLEAAGPDDDVTFDSDVLLFMEMQDRAALGLVA